MQLEDGAHADGAGPYAGGDALADAAPPRPASRTLLAAGGAALTLFLPGEVPQEASMGLELSLRGRKALVTGGSTGIGEGIAMALAEAGADVAISYTNRQQLAFDVVQQLESRGVNALALRADVSKAPAVAALFEEFDKQWGQIDILADNAGIEGPQAMAWESDPAQFERVISTNLLGGYYCAREALRRMVPRRSGVIVSVSSIHEVIPRSGYGAYAASKAGLAMLMKTLAQEAGGYGIRVFSVAPGAVTARTTRGGTVHGSVVGEGLPAGRISSPKEVGRLVAILASDIGSSITGTTVFVDGGMMLHPAFEHGT